MKLSMGCVDRRLTYKSKPEEMMRADVADEAAE
jgi:hypothetical protein